MFDRKKCISTRRHRYDDFHLLFPVFVTLIIIVFLLFCIVSFHSPLVGNQHRLWQPLVAVSIPWSLVSQHFSVNSTAHPCSDLQIHWELLIHRFVDRKGKNASYLTWADALLFIVKFSANEANELSKSPVSTFPGLTVDGCGAADALCTPPIAEPRTFPVWKEPAPDDADEAGPAGFNTSPNASKPFVWLFSLLFFPRNARHLFYTFLFFDIYLFCRSFS